MSEATPGGVHTPARSTPDGAAALLHELNGLKTDQPGIADFSERMLARVIDFGIAYGTLLVLGVLAALVANATGHMPSKVGVSGQSLDRSGAMVFDLVILLVAVAYEIGPALIGRRSPGKRIVNLTVVDEQGQPASFALMAKRFAAWFVPLVAFTIGWSATFPGAWSDLFLVAGLAFVAWLFISIVRDDANRGWHDRFAGTQVFRPR